MEPKDDIEIHMFQKQRKTQNDRGCKRPLAPLHTAPQPLIHVFFSDRHRNAPQYLQGTLCLTNYRLRRQPAIHDAPGGPRWACALCPPESRARFAGRVAQGQRAMRTDRFREGYGSKTISAWSANPKVAHASSSARKASRGVLRSRSAPSFEQTPDSPTQ